MTITKTPAPPTFSTNLILTSLLTTLTTGIDGTRKPYYGLSRFVVYGLLASGDVRLNRTFTVCYSLSAGMRVLALKLGLPEQLEQFLEQFFSANFGTFRQLSAV